jgi:hypothetical protein
VDEHNNCFRSLALKRGSQYLKSIMDKDDAIECFDLEILERLLDILLDRRR